MAEVGPTFYFSLVLAVGGALLALNGFTPLVRVPFLHGGP